MSMASESDYRRKFGARLARLREVSGHTLAAVAGHVGVSTAAVQQWEACKTIPTHGKRQKLSELFGCGFDDSDILGDQANCGALAGADAAVLMENEGSYARLRAARQQAGFGTAAEAATKLGVPYSTYAGHESGSRGIKAADLARYAEAFGVSPGWLQFGVSSGVEADKSPSPQKGRPSLLRRMRIERLAIVGRIEELKAGLAEAERDLRVVELAIEHLTENDAA